jgi:hypothetical protein
VEDRRETGQVGEIQDLIHREKEEAERSFESARFETQLFERIRSARGARPTIWLVLLRKPGPVMALSALFLAVAGFLLFRKPSPSPFHQTVRAMSAVLEDARDGRQMKGQDSTAQRIATAEYTDFGWALKGVLYACERESLGEIELADAFSRVFLEEARQPAPGRDGGKSSFPRVESLKLRTGEDFQMFFTSFLKKFREV